MLRRPPLGPVAPKAHDMKREFRILSDIHPHFSAAPKPILYSQNEEIVGSPFFIMERKLLQFLSKFRKVYENYVMKNNDYSKNKRPINHFIKKKEEYAPLFNDFFSEYYCSTSFNKNIIENDCLSINVNSKSAMNNIECMP